MTDLYTDKLEKIQAFIADELAVRELSELPGNDEDGIIKSARSALDACNELKKTMSRYEYFLLSDNTRLRAQLAAAREDHKTAIAIVKWERRCKRKANVDRGVAA